MPPLRLLQRFCLIFGLLCETLPALEVVGVCFTPLVTKFSNVALVTNLTLESNFRFLPMAANGKPFALNDTTNSVCSIPGTFGYPLVYYGTYATPYAIVYT